MVEISICPRAANSRYTGITLPMTSICLRPSSCWSSSVKSRPLRTRPRDLRVFLQELFIEPGELREHLQIAKRLAVRTVAARAPGFCPERLPLIEQLAVARIAVDHPRRVRLKEILEDERLLVFGQCSAGFRAARETGRRPAPLAYSSI